MSFAYAVALTGSIATGKSSVAKLFKEMGVMSIDADEVAHSILNEEVETIAKMFGEHLVVQGKVNRKALGTIIFADGQKRQRLEALLHPLIYAHIETMATKLDTKKNPYLVDIPLFFETKHYPIEKVLVVSAPKEIQLNRLMQRNALSEKEAKQRIETQLPIEKKVKKASYVIDNSATLAHLKHECKCVKDEIMKDFT